MSTSRMITSLADMFDVLAGRKTAWELLEESRAKRREEEAARRRKTQAEIDAVDPYRGRNLQAELDQLEARVFHTKEYVEQLETDKEVVTDIIKDAKRLIEQLEATKSGSKIGHAAEVRRMKLQPAERRLESIDRRLPGMKKVLKQWEEELKKWKSENSKGLKAQRAERKLTLEVHAASSARY